MAGKKEISVTFVPIVIDRNRALRIVRLGANHTVVSLHRKIFAANFDPHVTEALLGELDAATFTIGEIQSCFADSAYAAVEEMYEALTKLQPE